MTLKPIEYYGAEDIEYPARPRRPYLTDRYDPVSIRQYADDLEAYTEAKAAHDVAMKDYRTAVNGRLAELVVDLAADYQITEAQAKVVFNMAWEDGHSSGVHEVVQRFEELVDMAMDFAKAG